MLFDSAKFDPIKYIAEQLKEWWDFLWNFSPFPDSALFNVSMAALLIGFSCVAIILDYFNDDGNDDE